MSITWDKRNRRWRFYFDRTIGASRARASKLLPKAWSHTQARAYNEREEARLYALATGIERVEDRPLISVAVQLYLEHRCPALKDQKKIAQNLALLVPYFTGRTLPDFPDIVKEYRDAHAHLKPSTVTNRLACLKAAVSYAYREEKVGDRDYAHGVRLPDPNNERQEYLEVAELRRFLRHVDDQDARDLFIIAFYTGLRWRANILPLTREQIIRHKGQVWLSIQATRTKNKEPLMVPVPAAAQDALRSIPFAKGSKYFYRRFWIARKAIRRPGVRPHDLRHSLASYLKSNGASLLEIGEVLGHKSAAATQRYAHLYPHRRAELVGKIPRISRRKAA